MNRTRFEPLATAALDGVATPAEREQLEAMIATDPELRQQWEALEVATHALAEIQPVAPPADLAPGVMRQIQVERQARPQRNSRALGWLTGMLTPRIGIVFATACAAVAIVWVIAGNRQGSLGGMPVSGTLMPQSEGQSTVLAVGTTNARLQVRPNANGFEILIEAHGPDGGELVIEHDPALTADGIRKIQSQPRHVSYGPGRVALEFSGDVRFAVRLKGVNADAESFRVTVRSREGTAEGVLRGR